MKWTLMQLTTSVPGSLEQTLELDIDSVEACRRVQKALPGLQVHPQDDCFVAGVYWGRMAYWNDRNGTDTNTGNVTVERLTLFIRDMILGGDLWEQEDNLDWKAGVIAGYIQAAHAPSPHPTGGTCSPHVVS